MNETWAMTARYVSRYRGALLGGIASAAAVALTLEPGAGAHTGIASASIRFALWFGMVATLLALCLTAVISLAQHRSSRPDVPRAIARKRS